MKFILRLAKIVSSLLTTSLWLAATYSISDAGQQIIPASSEPIKPLGENYLPSSLYSGTQISLNGRTLPAAWSQWQVEVAGKVHTGISDAGVTQLLGVELLSTENAAKQPVKWFSQSTNTPFVLTSWLKGGDRYLDVTELAQVEGWQLSTQGNTLLITTPAAKVGAIRLEQQPWGDRIVVDLDRPTPWQVKEEWGNSLSLFSSWVIRIDAAAQTGVNQQNPLLGSIPTSTPNRYFYSTTTSTTNILARPHTQNVFDFNDRYKVETNQSQTTLRVDVPTGLFPRFTTLPNPNRLAIDFRPEVLPWRSILWAPGLHWRQQEVDLDGSRFPVVWLEIDLHAGLVLKPIWSDPNTLVGTAPLIQTARRYAAVAAINGGFFNRHEQLPLGAIRRDGRWLSSPILDRGAIAWNDFGQVKIGRLSLQETLTTSSGESLPVLSLNSGYVQAGIARYTSDWGPIYTPLNDREIIVVVQNNQVTAQLPGGDAAKTAFPIPPNGYLLVIRDLTAAANSLPVGTTIVSQQSATIPSDAANYPQILGAGPLLVQNRQIVLDAKAEQFSDAFIRQTAPRSAIGITASGTLLIAAVHSGSGGNGPTLAEIARIMQQLGCVDALNLDGGSSTSLYLGGQLLDRSPSTAARVHNGLGVFLGSGE